MAWTDIPTANLSIQTLPINAITQVAMNVDMIGSVDVWRTANFSRESAMPVQIPQQPANTRISCKLSTSTANADTCRVKFYGHVYGTTLA